MIISILVFFVILSILVLVHELGHFIAARRAGVWVEEFGLGIPPRIFGKKIGETIYSLNLFPFGGFVKLHGEEDDKKLAKPQRAFLNKAVGARVVIILAGVFMNFVLAIVSFAIVYSFSGIPKKTGVVKVVEVREGSPAKESGLATDDVISKADETYVFENSEFIDYVDGKKGAEVVLEIKRGEETKEISVFPRENPPVGEGALGVVISDAELYYPPVWQRPFYGIYYGFREALMWGGLILFGLLSIFKNLFVGIVPKDLAGPVGIYAVTSEVTKMGLLAVINWMGIISVNLAVLNILPIPALDGGRLVFIIIEKFMGRRVLPKVESWIHTVSFGILLIVLLAITLREVKLVATLGLQGYLEFMTQSQGVR